MLQNIIHPNQRIFKRFLISYLFILVIPLALASLLYNEAASIVEQDARESRLFVLNKTRDMIDKHLSDIDETMVQLSLDPKLKKLVYMDKLNQVSPESYDVWEYHQSLNSSTVSSNTTSSNTFKGTFFIFFKNSGMVFSRGKTTYGFDDFYTDSFNYTNMPYDQWYDFYFNRQHYKTFVRSNPVNIDGTPSKAVTYVNTLPFGEFTNTGCLISFLIEEENIEKLLSINSLDKSGWFLIVDKKGQIITDNSSGVLPVQDILGNINRQEGFLYKTINGTESILVYTRSNFNDWVYIVALPRSVIMHKVNYIRIVALGVAVITFIVGILISILLAYRNTKPLKEIISTLKEFIKNDSDKADVDSTANEYTFLQGSINQLINHNAVMKDALKRHTTTLKSIFLERVIKGEFDDRSKIETLLSHIGLNLGGKNYYSVIDIKINRYDHLLSNNILEELNIFSILLESTLEKHLGDNGHLVILNENEIALILYFTTDRIEYCYQTIKDLTQSVYDDITKQHHVTHAFGIGDLYKDIMDIHYSFREARQALEYFEQVDSSEQVVCWYRDIPKVSTCYFYPAELELKITNITKAGNWHELSNTLDKVYEENYVLRTLPKALEKHLIYDMKATILKLVGELNSDADMEVLTTDTVGKADSSKIFNDIKAVYYKICSSVNANKKYHNKKMLDNMVGFIDANFTDSNLSGFSIASKFNITESYFSQFFKEQMGETFSSYLENMRIQLACKYISEADFTVEEIAAKTGYNSTHSFRRAFKRVMGIAPSVYAGTQKK